MAQTPEGKVKAQVRKILTSYGVYYFSPVTGGYGKSGVPDIIACYRGRFIAIECKAGKGKLTDLQARELTLIFNAEGIPLVINEDNMAALTKTLEKLRE